MIRLRVENYNMTFIEKLENYLPDHQAKLNILILNEYFTGEEILPPNQKKIVE